MTGVYAIRHVASGRVYVGSSIDIHKRWGQHVRDLEHGKHCSQYFQHAWSKHGSDAFEFVVLETCLPDERIVREQAWIDVTRAAVRGFGFNLSVTAGLAVTMTPEGKERHRAARLGKKRPGVGEKIAASLRGQRHSEERKRNISLSKLGKKMGPQSAEHRAKRAAAQVGKKHSPESIAKMSASHTGRLHSAETREKMSQAHKKRRGQLTLVMSAGEEKAS